MHLRAYFLPCEGEAPRNLNRFKPLVWTIMATRLTVEATYPYWRQAPTEALEIGP